MTASEAESRIRDIDDRLFAIADESLEITTANARHARLADEADRLVREREELEGILAAEYGG